MVHTTTTMCDCVLAVLLRYEEAGHGGLVAAQQLGDLRRVHAILFVPHLGEADLFRGKLLVGIPDTLRGLALRSLALRHGQSKQSGS